MPDSNETDPLDELAEDDEDALPALQPTEDAANEKKIRKRRQTLKSKAAEEDQYLRGILRDEVGRRVLWKILNEAHAFETRFACGPAGFPDTNATWFHAGQQDIGQRLYQTWQMLDPPSVFLMLAENDARFKPKSK